MNLLNKEGIVGYKKKDCLWHFCQLKNLHFFSPNSNPKGINFAVQMPIA